MFVYLINRQPTKSNNFVTPLKRLSEFGSIPSILSLTPKIFDYVTFVHVLKINRTKIEPCAIKCIFLHLDIIKRDINILTL
jgi:hypothetical protein